MRTPVGGVINVLHLISRLPVGGVENMVLKVVTRYRQDRFRAAVCCMKEGGQIADTLVRGGYRVEVMHGMRGHRFDWMLVKRLRDLFRGWNVHVLRTHQYHANLYGRIAGVLAGVPVIVPSFHNLYRSPAEPKLHRRLINHILSRFSDALVAVSDAVAADIVRYDRVRAGKVRVIRNGVDMREFSLDMGRDDARRTLGLPPGVFLIGSVGRLDRQKGHSLIIKAAAGMKGVHLAFAGEGPLRTQLETAARDLSVACTFLGRLDPGRVSLYLRALDVFCFPSFWEGLPSALIEAMAAGLPVVASDIPPHREVVGAAGLLVRPNDGEVLRAELERLIGDGFLRKRLGDSARTAAARYAIEETVSAYEALFEDILAEKGCR